MERIERGWAGHFCAADGCKFRRNTLIHDGDKYIVVSTVGNYWYDNRNETIGVNRYYETMAFYALSDDAKYHDADVHRQIEFNSRWCINQPDSDNEANAMHDDVVLEIMRMVEKGTLDATN